MRGTVLIVEDDTRIANWVKVCFERAGFSAGVTHDGESGMELAHGLLPDPITIDIMLPRLDGEKLCRILRRESDIPLIMLTAREAQDHRIIGLENGAEDNIVKPFAPEAVIARAVAVLRRVKGRVQKVPFSLETPTNLPEMALDLKRMGQALGNVLNNAIRCSEVAGLVVVRAELEGEGQRLLR